MARRDPFFEAGGRAEFLDTQVDVYQRMNRMSSRQRRIAEYGIFARYLEHWPEDANRAREYAKNIKGTAVLSEVNPLLNLIQNWLYARRRYRLRC
ncbi:unnamed protein product [Peniophora sp. CBMAI 1063]|nr:unnamed protein product [Peniophora sp. CBMAI 1063]